MLFDGIVIAHFKIFCHCSLRGPDSLYPMRELDPACLMCVLRVTSELILSVNWLYAAWNVVIVSEGTRVAIRAI